VISHSQFFSYLYFDVNLYSNSFAGAVASQMNWFQVEARLRKLVQKILSPIVERNLEDRRLNLKNEVEVAQAREEIEVMKQYLFRDRQVEQEELGALRATALPPGAKEDPKDAKARGKAKDACKDGNLLL